MAEIAKTGNAEVDKAVEEALKTKGLEVTTTATITTVKTPEKE